MSCGKHWSLCWGLLVVLGFCIESPLITESLELEKSSKIICSSLTQVQAVGAVMSGPVKLWDGVICHQCAEHPAGEKDSALATGVLK